MTIEEYINDKITDTHPRQLALLWLPVLERWVAAEGWDAVRKWVYAYKGPELQWWLDIRRRMTNDEARREDERRLAVTRQLAKKAVQIVQIEQQLIQQILTGLITALLGKL